ncbi:MAG: hypothetical protein E7540_01905 [Ruminococcaceae bacterium]|nr:hypothetical protein [Oscillospiraceae bacterium]
MNKLGFEKKRSKYCTYCVYAKPLEYTDEVFCIKKGFVDKFSKCLKYKYDPLKRKPEAKNLTSKYSAEDFKL